MFREEFEKWNRYKKLDEELRLELNAMDEETKKDAFYKSVEFATAGMRGIIGAGTNRMNKYTIRKANYGFGMYLVKKYKGELERGVVIAHDNRHKSVEFSKESACVLASLGIKSYIFESLRPTPELSFAVRRLGAIGGIVVTASHNPAAYNGYKIYDEDGCQYVPRMADKVIENVNEIENVFNIDYMDYEEALSKGLIEIIGEEIDREYLEAVDTVQLNQDLDKNLKVVFTPLHGTSAKIGLIALERNGYDVIPVIEQLEPDPDFSTVKSPNPESKEAFAMAIEYGKKHKADILIATDPDADRLGVAVRHNGEYILLTGNQTGAILVDYILRTRKNQGTLPTKGKVFDTVVTSGLGAAIAKSYGMEVESTLTGFKFIGEKAKQIEDTEYEFMFGYEESYGYVIKDFVRDKDSIQALLLISEVANLSKRRGLTLYDYLIDLYEKHGFYKEDLVNIVLEGAEGEERIKEIIEYFRANKPTRILDLRVFKTEDYLTRTRYFEKHTNEIDLPISNVLKFVLEDGSWFVLRPSGTEPKLKIYIGVVGKTLEDSLSKNKEIKEAVLKIIDRV
ncbi:Phosphoglucomutase [Candidatus Izimaplasma bacterium HR1]|uniref:phospho-sugar mutase n=1 Tax=Candidatus Izimoplasma sp. HR1 TaxID=1541959 RepID=UPI0004F59295|nr:Phosphoglucomutase [Candidatus Izimaplasma bacterium HR1]